MSWTGLRRVDIGEGDQEAVSNSQNKSSEIDNTLVRRTNLDRASDSRKQASEPESGLASKEMREAACCEGGQKGAEGEEGADQLLKCSL